MDEIKAFAAEHSISLNAALTIHLTWGSRVREASMASISEAIHFAAFAREVTREEVLESTRS